ncbi:MAG: hypothetical protein Q4E62_01610 [Sutterellaceae bacterium]|nr:hypothetical protein [Sutterellaceae bacterium]
MTVAWQSIPARGLVRADDAKNRKIVLKRLNAALGKELTETLLANDLIVLMNTFDGQSALCAGTGKGILPMERTCIFSRQQNVLYINLEHAENPALVAQVVSTLAFDTADHDHPHFELFISAAVHHTLGSSDEFFDPLGHRDAYEKRTRIQIRQKLDRLLLPKAFLEDYWLQHYEGRKRLPSQAKCKLPKTFKTTDPNLVKEVELVKYFFGNIHAFAQTRSHRQSDKITVSTNKAVIRLASLAQITHAKLPSVEEFFGKEVYDVDLELECSHPYPADLGTIGENCSPRHLWNLDTEMTQFNWLSLYEERSVPNNKVEAGVPSIFATGIVMASRERVKGSAAVVTTHEVDMSLMRNRTISFLPFVSCATDPLRAQLVECNVAETLDWALLSLHSPKYDLNFQAINTSWLAQCDKLDTNIDYAVNLAFWAMSAKLPDDDGKKDLVRIKKPGSVPEYCISCKITEVFKESFIEIASFTVFTVKPRTKRRAFPELTAAMKTSDFKALGLKKGMTVTLKGVFLITDIKGLKLYRFDMPDVELELPGLSPLTKRRELNLAVVNDEISPEAAAVHLGQRVSEIAAHHRHGKGYYEALMAAAAYGHPESLNQLTHLYEQALDRREQLKNYDMDFVMDCEGKVIDRFLNLCQMSCQAPLEFLAFSSTQWLPTPADIRQRLAHYLAVAHNSGKAFEELGKRYRGARAFDKMSPDEIYNYRSYLTRAIFQCEYSPATKSFLALNMSGQLPHLSMEDSIGLVLKMEQTYLPARHWFSGMVLLQDKFFESSPEVVFNAFLSEAQYGSPVYVHDFAWFLLTTASDDLNRPKQWALCGAALLRWLAERYQCSIYNNDPETVDDILNRLGVKHKLAAFDPWAYLGVPEPQEPTPLVKTVRPMGFPDFLHLVFVKRLINFTPLDEHDPQVGSRLTALFDFLSKNSKIVHGPETSTAKSAVDRMRNARLLTYDSHDGNECVLAELPTEDGRWIAETVNPVFNQGLEIDAKLIGGVTDIGLCNGVVSATVDGNEKLNFFEPYWLTKAPNLIAGDVHRISFYGMGEISCYDPMLENLTSYTNPKLKHIACLDARTAQYFAVTTVKSIKLDAVQLAGVSFAKVVLTVNDFVPTAANLSLPVYVPMKILDTQKVKARSEVVAVFELFGLIQETDVEPDDNFGVRTIN